MPGPSDGPIYLSATSAARAANCEMQYVLEKVRRPEVGGEVAKSAALLLGSLVHLLLAAWYQGRDWKEAWLQALEDDPWWEPGFGWDVIYDRAAAIMEDWVAKHGEKPDVTMLAVELPFDIEVPGVAGVRVRGFLDGVVAEAVDDNRTHDKLSVLEFKTMGRWGRERLVPHDPQLLLYLWAARQMFPVTAARFDAVSTYKYKDPSPEKRFKRLVLEHDQRKEDRMLADLQKVARRVKQLHKNPDLAIRNVGMDTCHKFGGCDHMARCLEPWTLEEA